jgi:N-carbamoyl-L-amino-acid hydrolase
VDGIVGIYRESIVIFGEHNHAGTTMMSDRSDALVASSKLVLEVDRIVRERATNAVATVGKLDVFPNVASIIPGKVELIIEIRAFDQEEREEITREIKKSLNEIKESYYVEIFSKNILDQRESWFDKDIVAILQEAAKSLEIPSTTLKSMAGHDATHLVDVTKAAMIFVKSIGGKSHSFDELSLPEDIEKAANTMLNAVLLADKKLTLVKHGKEEFL